MDPSERFKISQYVELFWEAQKEGTEIPDLILSVDNDLQLKSCVSLFDGFPEVATTIRTIFVNGPDSGIESWIAAFRSICENMASYWGYIGPYAAIQDRHIERFIQIKDDPAAFVRHSIKNLEGAERVSLWSIQAGYQPPG